MKKTVIAGWTAAISALITMFIGHWGARDLSWISNQISTYAAQSPNDAWITASMLISAAALVCISLLISKHQILGANGLVHVIPVLIGAVIAGLILLAFFEETARTIKMLKVATFEAIRQQSFHDAGLMVFFYGSIGLAILAGLCCAIFRRAIGDKLLGALIAGLGPIAFFLMTTAWPKLIKIDGPSAGLKQRAALLCIWIAMALLLSLATYRSAEKIP